MILKVTYKAPPVGVLYIDSLVQSVYISISGKSDIIRRLSLSVISAALGRIRASRYYTVDKRLNLLLVIVIAVAGLRSTLNSVQPGEQLHSVVLQDYLPVYMLCIIKLHLHIDSLSRNMFPEDFFELL